MKTVTHDEVLDLLLEKPEPPNALNLKIGFKSYSGSYLYDFFPYTYLLGTEIVRTFA